MKARIILNAKEVKALKESAKNSGVEIKDTAQIRDDIHVELSFKSQTDLFKLGQYIAYTVCDQETKTK